MVSPPSIPKWGYPIYKWLNMAEQILVTNHMSHEISHILPYILSSYPVPQRHVESSAAVPQAASADAGDRGDASALDHADLGGNHGVSHGGFQLVMGPQNEGLFHGTSQKDG